MLAMNQVYYWLINDKGSQCAWVSPTYRQAKKVYDEMVQAFINTGLIKTNTQDLTIKVGNSKLQFFSSERYDNLRGFTFDYMVMDEAAHQAEEAWTEVLRATILIRGKKVLLISTPKGKNWFFNMLNLASVNDKYRAFTQTSYDGLAEASEIDDARRTLPDHVFRQEYLAEFIDGGTSPFINWEERIGDRTGRLYAGIDLGRADDWTVLTIVNEKGDMVFCDRWRQDSWTNIVNNLCKHLKDYQPQTFIEVNSVGDAIFEQICKGYEKQKCHPFVTSSKSKQDIIEQLIVVNQNKEASIIGLDWLKKEYEVFTYEYNPKSKNVRYTAPPGFHDDGVMSHAIAIEANKKLKTRGQYSVI